MMSALRIALLAVACLAIAPTAPARAQFGPIRRAEAVVIAPFLLAPTTYAVPTAYASSYSLAPAAYYDAMPASYLVPTYAETRYFRPWRYRYRPFLTTARYYENSLTPSSYYLPTSAGVVYPTVATYGSLCDEPARVTTGRTVTDPSPATTLKSEASSTSNPEPRLAPRKLSVPRDADPTAQEKVADKAADPEPTSPPAGDPAPAAKPAEDLPRLDEGVPMPGPGGASQGPRTAHRFVFPNSAVLRGDVVMAGEPQQGVKVMVVSRTDPAKYLDLAGVTDADGHFAIRVPTGGDWTLQVARPGGRQITQEFTLAAGRFRDGKGEFPSLTIDYK